MMKLLTGSKICLIVLISKTLLAQDSIPTLPYVQAEIPTGTLNLVERYAKYQRIIDGKGVVSLTEKTNLDLDQVLWWELSTAIDDSSKSIVFPRHGSSQFFYSILVPPSGTPFHSSKFLKDNRLIKSYIQIEELLKQTDTIKADGVYWSYVVDKNSKYVIGLNLSFGNQFKWLIRFNYRQISVSRKLPKSISEFAKEFPDLTYLYEAQSDYTSSERIIKQDLERKSLKSFNNDTLAYLQHTFYDRNILFINSSFKELITGVEIKPLDYRVLKMYDGKVFGLMIKYLSKYSVFIRINDGGISKDAEPPLYEVAGYIAMSVVVNTESEQKRIDEEIRRMNRFSMGEAPKLEKDYALLKKFYML